MPRGVSWWHVLGDCLAIALAFLLAYVLRFGLLPAPLGVIPPAQWLYLTVLNLPLWLLIFALHGLYYTRLKQAFAAEIGSVTHAAAEGLLAAIVLTFGIRGLPDSRMALLIAVALAWLLLALYRALARKLRRVRPRAVVIGDSPLCEYLRRQFAGRATRFELAAAYATAEEFTPDGADAVFCEAHQAAVLWQRLPAPPSALAVYLLPQDGLAGSAALAAATVEGVPVLSVKSAYDLAVMRRIKRLVDLIGASVLLLLTAPFWLVCLSGDRTHHAWAGVFPP